MLPSRGGGTRSSPVSAQEQRLGGPKEPGTKGEFPAYKKLRESRFATDEGCHSPPREVLIPRLFNAAAIARNVSAPSARIERRTGVRLRANPSAPATETARPLAPASRKLTGLPN